MHSSDLPFSQACENNQAPILVVLRDWLAHSKRVLEIGTGTGQHAVHFAAGLTHLHWLPSDHPETLWQSRERLARDAPVNLQQPALALDVAQRPWPDLQVDAVFSANTAHIMSWSEVEAMFRGVGDLLPAGGCFCLYGPFNQDGRYTSESNKRFDSWLRERSPNQGIRDLEALKSLAAGSGLSLEMRQPMPANNQLLLWRRVSH
jgi:cyclopropane fatty-acyl-phospholipid synthase-like methyltransferase